MTKKIKLLTLLRIFLYTTFVLGLLFLFLCLFSIVTPALFVGDIMAQRVIYLFLAVLFSMLCVYFFIVSINYKKFRENLKVENSYTLGKRTSFYNLEAFKNRVAKLRNAKRNEKKLQFLIAFTPASLELSSNQFRNPEIIRLNLLIADYATLLFEKFKNDFNVNESAYAFNRGIFFIFILSDDVEKVHILIADISNQIYKIVNGEKLKVWVQPFFGIKQIERKETIIDRILVIL